MLTPSSATELLAHCLELVERPVVVLSSRGELLAANALGRAHFGTERGPHWTLVSQTGEALLLVAKPKAGAEQTKLWARTWALTERERGVLERLVLGEPNKVIAQELGCSERTVEVHVSRVLAKSKCASRAVLIANVLGLR